MRFAQLPTDTRKRQDVLHRELDKLVVAKNAAIVKKEKQSMREKVASQLRSLKKEGKF